MQGEVASREDGVCMKNGWKSKPIRELADIFNGGTPSTTIPEYWDGNIVWVVPTDVTGQKNKYLTSSERKITNKGLMNSAAVLLPIGTILLCSRATIGELAIAAEPMTTNQGFKNLVCFTDTDNEWLYYALQPLKSKMIDLASGSTFLEISKSTLGNIEVLTPTDKSEQHRIATVLSDTDALISTLEMLIAKKRAIKQGAMQELLTGKRRLPGFKDKWVEKKVSDFGDVVTGATPSTIIAEYWNGNIPWVTPTDISVVRDIVITERMITEDGLSIIRELPANTLLITCIASIGKNAILRAIGASNQQINAIVPNAYYDVNFLYYLFELSKTYMLRKAGQTATNIISKYDFSELTFTVPCSLLEQTAVAAILSDIDSELNALTTKLNKLRHIKQGMMSDLLTGRIRLLEQEPQKKHNQAIEDAVILGVITELYATEQYPLVPFYAQKLPYLLHRHIEGIAKGYYKLSAGPYNPSYRYKTALPIALKNNYVVKHKATYMGHEYNNLTIGENGCEAKKYFLQWHGDEPLNWLMQFRYIKNRKNELELLTTVDMAMTELRHNNMPITVTAIKKIIKNSKEWKAKLTREIFSDANIERAIKWSNNLFGMEDTHNGED